VTASQCFYPLCSGHVMPAMKMIKEHSLVVQVTATGGGLPKLGAMASSQRIFAHHSRIPVLVAYHQFCSDSIQFRQNAV